MNQDYKKTKLHLLNEEKAKSLIIQDDTETEGGKPKPEGTGTTLSNKGDDDDDAK